MREQQHNGTESEIKFLAGKFDNLIYHFEKMRIEDYMRLLDNIPRMLYLNFLIGVARGFGISVGITLIGALLLYILRHMITLPLIGEYIAQIVEIVQYNITY